MLYIGYSGLYLYLVFSQQTGQAGKGEQRFLNPVAFGVNSIVLRGPQVGLLQYGLVKNGLVQLTVLKYGLRQVTLRKINLFQLHIFKPCLS